MLRIDPSGGDPYAIPAGQPVRGRREREGRSGRTGCAKSWQSFDAGTGDLLIGDVGQSDWEEIDRAPADSEGGENYGWASMEGTHPFRGGTEPANRVPPMTERASAAR
ncbi:hypothetical protein SBADM41S_10846 [Streptomyces badius]